MNVTTAVGGKQEEFLKLDFGAFSPGRDLWFLPKEMTTKDAKPAKIKTRKMRHSESRRSSPCESSLLSIFLCPPFRSRLSFISCLSWSLFSVGHFSVPNFSVFFSSVCFRFARCFRGLILIPKIDRQFSPTFDNPLSAIKYVHAQS